MWPKLLKFFDKLEDHIRGWLSHYPLIYGLVAGSAIVLFWRGVWETSDLLFIHPVTSLLLGLGGLLATGVLVSEFIGTGLIISGLRGEKKLEEHTVEELNREEQKLDRIYDKLEEIQTKVDRMGEEK